MDKYFYPALNWACDYLSMLRLKLNHVSKRGPRICFKAHYGYETFWTGLSCIIYDNNSCTRSSMSTRICRQFKVYKILVCSLHVILQKLPIKFNKGYDIYYACMVLYKLSDCLCINKCFFGLKGDVPPHITPISASYNNNNSLFSRELQIGAHVTYKEIICKHSIQM